MERRFLITMSFYEWGETERNAFLRATQKVKDMDEAFDNTPCILHMSEMSFAGKSTPINFESLKQDLSVMNQVKNVEMEEKKLDNLAEQNREKDLHNENLQKDKI